MKQPILVPMIAGMIALAIAGLLAWGAREGSLPLPLAITVGILAAALIGLSWPRRVPAPAAEETGRWLVPAGGGKIAGFPLTKERMAVGRDVACDIFLNSEKVSRHHAELLCRPGEVVLRDLDSANGTFVNGQRVIETLLSPGDAVTFADLEFVFQAPALEPPPPPEGGAENGESTPPPSGVLPAKGGKTTPDAPDSAAGTE